MSSSRYFWGTSWYFLGTWVLRSTLWVRYLGSLLATLQQVELSQPPAKSQIQTAVLRQSDGFTCSDFPSSSDSPHPPPPPPPPQTSLCEHQLSSNQCSAKISIAPTRYVVCPLLLKPPLNFRVSQRDLLMLSPLFLFLSQQCRHAMTMHVAVPSSLGEPSS